MTKIMLVEDDNNLREIYEARLAAEGYDIVSAGDGEAALALAGKERPDMIISDVMMPKISGFEMLDILRNTDNLRDVKIIMLTALGQAEDAERANHLGADRYLVKSQVTLEDIVDTTHELLNDKEAATPDMSALPATPAEVDDKPEPATPAVAAVAAVPEAPAPVVPESAPSPAANVVPEAEKPIPVAEPAEPAASPSISIPVSDGPSDDAAATPADDTAATDDTAKTDDTAAPAATPIDYTSPENFNKFQAAPATPDVTSPVVDTNFTAPADDAETTEEPQPPKEEASAEPFPGSKEEVTDPVVADAPAEDAPAVEPAVVAPAPADELKPIADPLDMPVAATPADDLESALAEPPTVVEEPSMVVQPEPADEDNEPSSSDETVAPAPADATTSAEPDLHPISNLPFSPEVSADVPDISAEPPVDPIVATETAPNTLISPEAPVSETMMPGMMPDPLDMPMATPPAENEDGSTAPAVDSTPAASTPALDLPQPTAPDLPATDTAVSDTTADTTMSDPFASTRNKTAPATDEPVPEELNPFQDPTIVTGGAETPTDDKVDEDLVAAALKDLEKGADGEPSEPQYGDADKKVIAPTVETTEKPDIDRLLELEAAKSSAKQAAASVDEVVPAPPEEDEKA